MQDPNRGSFNSATIVDGNGREPVSLGRQQSIKLDRLQQDNHISQSSNEFGEQEKEMGFHAGPYEQMNGLTNYSSQRGWFIVLCSLWSEEMK